MIIRYHVTIDDIMAFNRFHIGQSPTTRKAKVRWIVMSCIASPLVASFI